MELTQEIEAIIGELDANSDYIEESEMITPKDQFVFTPLDKDKDEQLKSIFEEIKDNSEVEKIKKQEIFEEVVEDEKIQVEEIIQKDELLKKEDVKNDFVKRNYKSSELLELTQTLNLKLDLQEAELDEVSKKVNFIDRILSFFVVFLIMTLLAVIFYGIYFVYVERGGF